MTWSTGLKQTIQKEKSPLCYIIANADDQNTPPTEQISVYLGAYRDPPRHKSQTSDNIY
jgi:hypothetical protein